MGHRVRLAPALALVLLGCPSSPKQPAPLRIDRFGGLTDVTVSATGYFHLQKVGDRDWLVDPDGHAFFSAGVNHVTAAGDTEKDTGATPYHDAVIARYGDEAAWASAVVTRLQGWHFNTIGAWSDLDRFQGQMPYTVILGLAQGSWHPGSVSDVFSTGWEDGVRAQVASDVAPRASDPWLLGYFTDNELRWSRDWTSLSNELLDDYLGFDAGTPGKTAVVQCLSQRYGGDVTAFDQTWGTTFGSFDELNAVTAIAPGPSADAGAVLADKRAFLAQVAERYFSFTSDAIRQADPNHLVLGCRLVPLLAPAEVLQAAGRHVDVLSVNNYVFLDGLGDLAQNAFGPLVDPKDMLSQFEAQAGRPILVSEFGFRAADAGLPNSWPPVFPVYPSQQARADALEHYVRAAFAKPYVVGLHWFEHADEPKGGRFDGEDSNWGLVNLNDDPYPEVTRRFQSLYEEQWRRDADAGS